MLFILYIRLDCKENGEECEREREGYAGKIIVQVHTAICHNKDIKFAQRRRRRAKIKTDNEHNKRNEIVTQTVTNWTKQPNTTAAAQQHWQQKQRKPRETQIERERERACVCV